MRLPRELAPSRSTTPIYDQVCADYRRMMRSLPGDRSDEERFHFEGFGTVHCSGATSGAPDGYRWRAGLPWRAALPPAPRDRPDDLP